MRFHLRTLMIFLAVGPPVLAGLWLFWPVLRAAALTFTARDGLWLALFAGLAIAAWIKQRRTVRRIEAMARRIHSSRT